MQVNYEFQILNSVAVWPWPATKGHTVMWVGRRMERKRQKLVGLTEQQMKRTVTTTILIWRIYKIKEWNAQSNSHCLMPWHSQATTAFPLASPPPWNLAWRLMVPNTLFSLASMGQPTRLCPLSASGES